MDDWTIVYSQSVVHGNSLAEWLSAPDHDVQVIVEWRQPESFPWAGVTDRCLQTGVDEYAINGWPVKYGRWMDYEAYIGRWELAAHGSRDALR